jgi:hypothetical protein
VIAIQNHIGGNVYQSGRVFRHCLRQIARGGYDSGFRSIGAGGVDNYFRALLGNNPAHGEWVTQVKLNCPTR